ncbi:MAG: hypothetical protein KatS3mg038_3545 [Candidatus Kapaibacterium sp.]|nr:MAG: hypothetical protein KatS3mg038_3545 [Candidatus Kapabacteria bacterium]GIV57060.1 MAG: hypothetical protein KatS3mg040_1828 [Candidatus Kapabacteria bacterium]
MRYVRFAQWIGAVLGIAVVVLLLSSDAFAQRRSGSFGGSRGASRSYSVPRSAPPSSFGGSRSYSVPRSAAPRSFGGTRTQEPAMPLSARQPLSRSSSIPRAIGTPLASPESYRRSYGIPRRQEVRTLPTPEGQRNVIVHSYGGYGDGLLMGYLLGHTSWLWFTPFHPAFYYTQPYYVPRPDGTVEYYPPTFSLAKLLFVLIVVGAIVFIAWVIIRNRRLQRGMLPSREGWRSSFGG